MKKVLLDVQQINSYTKFSLFWSKFKGFAMNWAQEHMSQI